MGVDKVGDILSENDIDFPPKIVISDILSKVGCFIQCGWFPQRLWQLVPRSIMYLVFGVVSHIREDLRRSQKE